MNMIKTRNKMLTGINTIKRFEHYKHSIILHMNKINIMMKAVRTMMDAINSKLVEPVVCSPIRHQHTNMNTISTKRTTMNAMNMKKNKDRNAYRDRYN